MDGRMVLHSRHYGDRPTTETDRGRVRVRTVERASEWTRCSGVGGALERSARLVRLVTHSATASQPASQLRPRSVPARSRRRVRVVRPSVAASLVAVSVSLAGRRRRALLPREAVFVEVLSGKQVRPRLVFILTFVCLGWRSEVEDRRG